MKRLRLRVDYYVTSDKKHNGYVYNTILNQVETMFDVKTFSDMYKGLIATTNTSLQCPQVVDYVEELFKKECGEIVSDIDNVYLNGLIEGYQKHSETHSLSDEEVIKFTNWCTDNYFESGVGTWIDNPDFDIANRFTTKELLMLFKSTIPIKVYYR